MDYPSDGTASLDAPPADDSGTPRQGLEMTTPSGDVAALESWLTTHSVWLALILVAAGLVLRLLRAIPAYLNPDEAYHFLIASQPTLVDTLRAGVRDAHPPFRTVLLFFWTKLGSSDFFVRLPSVLAGSGALWVAYQWLRRTLGTAAALAGLVILTFSPPLVALSAEVREYSLLLFFLFACLYSLDRGLRERSTGMLVAFSAMLALAVLTHYSAILVAGALGVYTLVWMFQLRPRRGVVLAWVLGQLLIAGITAYLYLGRMSILKSSGQERFAKEGWLRASYFNTGEDRVIPFIVNNTLDLFRYIFSSYWVGLIALVCFLAGIGFLLSRRKKEERPGASSRMMVLLLLPPLVAISAALAGASPYGGTRHCVFLLPFLVAGIAYGLAGITRHRIWPLLVTSVVLVPIWVGFAALPSQRVASTDLRREQVSSALAYLEEITPSGGIVVTDYQSEMLLRRYLLGNGVAKHQALPDDLLELPMRGIRFIRSGHIWSMSLDSLDEVVTRVANNSGLGSGDWLTVAWMGWGENPAIALRARYGQVFADTRTFGSGISIFRVQVGQAPMAASGRILSDLAGSVTLMLANSPGPVKTVMWPASVDTEIVRPLLQQTKARLMTYPGLYSEAQTKRSDLQAYLPALAFWVVRNAEQHPPLMRYMDDIEHFISGDYRFTLLVVSPDSATAVYLVDSNRR